MRMTSIHEWPVAGPLPFATAVSLHSHTSCSQEFLSFLPAWSDNVPLLRRVVSRELARRRHGGSAVRRERPYWRPPASPLAVLRSEEAQIATRLQMRSLVSITDHDSFAAPAMLYLGGRTVPWSVEWTVWFRNAAFHLGLHNVAPARAGMVAELMALGACLSEQDLRALIEWLREAHDTLIVLNHPLRSPDGGQQDVARLHQFVHAFRQHIDAFELNGFRPWRENRAVMGLAESYAVPVVSGGDRHGLAPNAMLNLTNASTVSEFVEEVRRDGCSHVAIMPEYRQPLVVRTLAVVRDVLRTNARKAGDRSQWTRRAGDWNVVIAPARAR